MSKTADKPSKQPLIVALAVVLVMLFGIQIWYMADMKSQLDDLKTRHSSTQPDRPGTPGKSQGTARAPDDMMPALPDRKFDTKPWPQKQRPAPPDLHSFFDDDFFNTPYDARTWNPYEEIQRMQRNMDRMFNNTFDQFYNSPDFHHFYDQSITTPEMDVKEDDTQYTIIVNLPGLDENNISVTLEGQTLTIDGRQEYQKTDKDSAGDIIFKERRSGKFKRSITLPEPIIENRMKTKIDNGLLIIIIPKDKQPA